MTTPPEPASLDNPTATQAGTRPAGSADDRLNAARAARHTLRPRDLVEAMLAGFNREQLAAAEYPLDSDPAGLQRAELVKRIPLHRREGMPQEARCWARDWQRQATAHPHQLGHDAIDAWRQACEASGQSSELSLRGAKRHGDPWVSGPRVRDCPAGSRPAAASLHAMTME